MRAHARAVAEAAPRLAVPLLLVAVLVFQRSAVRRVTTAAGLGGGRLGASGLAAEVSDATLKERSSHEPRMPSGDTAPSTVEHVSSVDRACGERCMTVRGWRFVCIPPSALARPGARPPSSLSPHRAEGPVLIAEVV